LPLLYVIFFGPKGHFVMNRYLYYWTWNLVIILLLYVWFEHPGLTYGGFVPSLSERGMTKILVQLPAASAETVVEQDETQV
jgi:hypothetical protein